MLYTGLDVDKIQLSSNSGKPSASWIDTSKINGSVMVVEDIQTKLVR